VSHHRELTDAYLDHPGSSSTKPEILGAVRKRHASGVVRTGAVLGSTPNACSKHENAGRVTRRPQSLQNFERCIDRADPRWRRPAIRVNATGQLGCDARSAEMPGRYRRGHPRTIATPDTASRSQEGGETIRAPAIRRICQIVTACPTGHGRGTRNGVKRGSASPLPLNAFDVGNRNGLGEEIRPAQCPGAMLSVVGLHTVSMIDRPNGRF